MQDQQASKEFAVAVVKKLRDAGFEALWAGGCVRDQLLNRTPKDFDVATSAHPDQVRDLFGRKRSLPIGAAFGVITLLGPPGADQIEVATFRQDAGYSDGRHPDKVIFSSAKEDALRRDFTINGLFYDPIDHRVIDYVGGQEDLRAGLIRAIGDAHQRIAEDKLRMLRAIRFAATFGFAIEPETMAAIQRDAPALSVVSPERIAAELRRMLAHENRAHAVQLMYESGLLLQIIPEAKTLGTLDISALQQAIAEQQSSAPPADNNEAAVQTLTTLHQLSNSSFPLGLAALLRLIPNTNGADIDKADCDETVGKRHGKTFVDKLGRRLKLSNDERVGAAWLVAHVADVLNADQLPWPAVQRLLIRPDTALLMDFANAVARAVGQDERGIEFCRQKLQLSKDQLDPKPFINGNDLKEAGIRPGRQFRHVLDTVRNAQLNGQLADRESALALAKQLCSELPENGQ